MHKTMLAALIVATSALSIPAFAQVNLGGAAQVGAGVNTGAAVPNAMHTVDQTRAQTTQTLHRADHRAKRMTHKAVDTTRSTVHHGGSVDAGVNADSSMNAGAGSMHAGANTDATGASVDSGAAANQASQTGQDIGNQASDTAHSAMQSADHTAGSVSNTINQNASGQSVGADAKVNAKAAAHGH